MHRLRLGSRVVLILTPDERSEGKPLSLQSEASIEAFLAPYLRDERNLATVRAIAGGRTAAETSRLFSKLVQQRRYRLASSEITTSSHVFKKEEPAPASETPPAEKIWIRFRVIDDATRQPIADVKLTITDPDGADHDVATDGDGMAEVKDVSPGSGRVKSVLPDAPRDQTLEFVGFGEEVPAPEPGPEEKPKPKGPFRIARIDRHRVRTNETLDSLAQGIALPWQKLAKFNWNTDQPKKINEHLRYEVGCTKKDASGANYMFDDADRPGIVLLPSEWSSSGHVTERTHTIRVRPIPRRIPLLIDDPFLGLQANLDVKAKYADGSEESLKTGNSAIVLVRSDRFTDKGNFADLKFKTEHREHKRRVFLVCEHASSKNGAWQRLVNLGFVADPEPTAEPKSDDILAAALEAFQAEHGIQPNGELDGRTASELDRRHEAEASFGDHQRTVLACESDAAYGANPKEAVA